MTQGKAPRRNSHKGPDRSGTSHDSWDNVAAWYDGLASDQGTDYHRGVVIPGTLKLLDIRRGQSVLDIACGQGAVARAINEAGAVVTGVDLSARLIDAARQRSTPGLRFLVGDARNITGLPRNSFDAAVCVLAAQNIDPIPPVFASAARLLRLRGRFVVVINHPAFRIPRQSRWKLDDGRKLLAREIDSYLSEMRIPIDMKPFKGPGKVVTHTHHRPLQAYVSALSAAGMAVDALEEWPSHRSSQPGPMARAENRARAEFPLFLAIRAIKLAEPPADKAVGEAGPAGSNRS